MYTRPFLGFFLFAALALPAFAATLNVVVVETGGGGNSTADFFESSSLWEGSFLDVFFEAGYIVSNSPVLHLDQIRAGDFPGKETPDKAFPPELDIELEDATAGGADFLIIALLTYPTGAVDRRVKPEQVSLRIYKIRPYGFVYEGSQSPGAGVPAQPETESERAKRLIRGLIPHLKD